MEIINKKNIFFITLISIFIVFSVFLFSYFNLGLFLKSQNIKFIQIAGQKIKVELALTHSEQIKGLSGRKNINDDAGMLFIFEKLSNDKFWMKDMNFSVDMIWIDSDSNIIYIEKNVDPSSYPNTFGPNQDYKYVLEVKANFSEKNNLKVGEKVKFLP
ncbi:MAG: DUF192 domain-containing protein [bacterium]